MRDKPWWEDDHFLRLTIGIELMDEVERELLAPLRSLGIPAEIPPQGSGLPLQEVGAYIEVISTALGGVASAVFIAQQLNGWRHKRQEQKRPDPPRPTEVTIIIRPGREPLDIMATTTNDEDVAKYVTEGRESEE